MIFLKGILEKITFQKWPVIAVEFWEPEGRVQRLEPALQSCLGNTALCVLGRSPWIHEAHHLYVIAALDLGLRKITNSAYATLNS